MILAVLASLITWPLYVAVSLTLDVIGLMLIPFLAIPVPRLRRSKVWGKGSPYGEKVVTVWPGRWLTWLWGNEEDGVAGPVWYRARNPSWSRWRLSYFWAALRNPSNNMRFIPLINPIINPARVRSWVSDPCGRCGTTWFVWQGPFAGLWHWITIRGMTFRFIIGWKLKPEDSQGIPRTDMRAPRCGFGLQFKRVG